LPNHEGNVGSGRGGDHRVELRQAERRRFFEVDRFPVLGGGAGEGGVDVEGVQISTAVMAGSAYATLASVPHGTPPAIVARERAVSGLRSMTHLMKTSGSF